MYTRFLHTAAQLKPGDHLCSIYETEEEHRAILMPFLRQGLERGEKVIYIVDAHTAETVLGYLRDDGLDPEPYLARGQLVILTRDDAYMRDGVFEPDGMIALLRAETEKALAEGYPALRATGEMTWALRGLPGSKRLIEYEAKLNEFFPGSKCLAICQYDRRRFPPEVLLDVLRTHPIAVIGTEVYENFYYIPPAELLSGDLPAVELRHWLEGLSKYKKEAEALRESEKKYRELFDNARDVIVTFDLEGNVISVNKAVTEYGFNKDDIVGKNILSFVAKKYRARLFEELARIARGNPVEGEVELKTPKGEKVIEYRGSPIRRSKKVVGFQAILRDVTESKRAEKELKQSLEKLRRALEGTVSALASAVEMRDPYTAGHQRKVTRLACTIAKEIGLPEEQIRGLRMAALVHDIGKLAIPSEVLSKPGRLTEPEFELIKSHPRVAYEILKGIDFPWPVAQIVLQHHERMDGSGYPLGLKSEEILLEARILAVADVVEAVASHRPYRPALGIDKALEEIAKKKGVLYDAKVVDACLKLFTEKGFKFKE